MGIKEIFFKRNADDSNSALRKKMEKILPVEPEEAKNPKIKLYNEMVRHAMVYDTKPFSRCGVSSDSELRRVLQNMLDDYPEIFWIDGSSWYHTPETFQFQYRCINEDGVLDVKQIDYKRKALRRSAKFFTRGITKKTKPYDALITIYRRLILTLDYDTVGLNAHVDRDTTKDDKLRSLYSAIVEHKVVCAGYAVALQYLLQSVGISCGTVTSEFVNDSGHAFNAIKLGKECYYLDATWDDSSNTTSDEQTRKDISYDYCCVSLKELQLTDKSVRHDHTPNRELYPNLEEFTATRHEYFRYRNAYLTRYDEEAIVRVFANTALEYDEKEMGNFAVGFRCCNTSVMHYVMDKLLNSVNIDRVVAKAQALVKNKSRSAFKHLQRETVGVRFNENTSTFYYRFK